MASIIQNEQTWQLSPQHNNGKFCNNRKIDIIISKRLYVENKAKLSQLTRADFVTMSELTHEFQSEYL